MLVPSQIRSREPLNLLESGDGVFSFTNAYEGESQEFFDGRLTPIQSREKRPGRTNATPDQGNSILPVRPPLQGTAWLQEPVLQGSEEKLRTDIEEFLTKRLGPEKEADLYDVGRVFEQLKRSGSLCVSQIALETGLPLPRIFLALRQLAAENSVEWRPDRSPVVGIGNLLQKFNLTQALRDRSILAKLWGEWRKNSTRRSQPIELIETAWSIMRAWNSNPLTINARRSP